MATTSPDPHAAGSTRYSKWWVTNSPAGRGRDSAGDILRAIMSTARPVNAVSGPYTSQSAAQNWINKTTSGGGLNLPNLNPFSWLGSLGGMIGSGLEAGFINVIKDLWDVIIGPVEVLVGTLIVLWVLTVYFARDIMNIAGIAAMAAA